MFLSTAASTLRSPTVWSIGRASLYFSSASRSDSYFSPARVGSGSRQARNFANASSDSSQLISDCRPPPSNGYSNEIMAIGGERIEYRLQSAALGIQALPTEVGTLYAPSGGCR